MVTVELQSIDIGIILVFIVVVSFLYEKFYRQPRQRHRRNFNRALSTVGDVRQEDIQAAMEDGRLADLASLHGLIVNHRPDRPHDYRRRSLEQIMRAEFRAAFPYNKDVSCSMCKGQFAEGKMVKVWPLCGHTFHTDCVDEWISHSGKLNPACPGTRLVVDHNRKLNYEEINQQEILPPTHSVVGHRDGTNQEEMILEEVCIDIEHNDKPVEIMAETTTEVNLNKNTLLGVLGDICLGAPTLTDCQSAFSYRKESCCSICFEEFTTGALVKAWPECGHIFHENCIDHWLSRNLKPMCPLCRHQVWPVMP